MPVVYRCAYSKAIPGNVDVTLAVAVTLRREYVGSPELSDISDEGGWRVYRGITDSAARP